ncbi:MAG: adenylate kinase [Candidatus Marinimicrobia bacterium]|jgi:adenylate kinase|nr:adenylate kinase [Candidatus Neomarinimicrobiota bacterium]MBT3948055.1 adenylate kinase [Candidatus Neomarinimicrobiota bacterium]MBT4065215.1 adenylate kinase [Candidatus Neomarinimicrobiota bacterium]MBT4307494.1 adenylate kinase [Candidatus Neomarinimicrobiota bacterium]MBT4452507.1 adenylate kinase [Candidatus Neomarinimicrobiota bacterium]|tara:strand:+ start:674 stop:1234 length:561 start_codon:yes stop_codon:yes gene_type:complete
MRLIFLGPPGVGKGTQAKRICEHYNLIHLSTGEILRNEIAEKTNIGRKAKSFIDAGELVPDDVLLGMMNNRLKKDDVQSGYLLDGFPRTIPQANGLDNIMNNISHSLDCALSLNADENELVQRLINRGKESGRSDDTPEIIRQRQKVYWEQTAPLLDFYREKNLLKEVNGIGDIPEITERILKVLN